MELDPKQQEAIDYCSDLDKRLVAVTGAAGTGKTTVIKNAYDKLIDQGVDPKHIALAAPTGKAANRMQEATGIEATTLHKLLEYSHPGEEEEIFKTVVTVTDDGEEIEDKVPFNPPKYTQLGCSEPRRWKQNPLTQKIIFVDEYAMVNRELHRNLVDALPSGGMLRSFGDVNQLPPIETGEYDGQSAFELLLGKQNSVYLEKIFRQDDDSGIAKNAKAILKGFIPKRLPGFSMTLTEQVPTAVAELIRDWRDKGVDFGDLNNQVITPSHRTWASDLALSGMIQNIRFPMDDDKWLQLPRMRQAEAKGQFCRIRVGDKVICTQNLYDLDVYNGDVGKVTNIDFDEGHVEVTFPDKVIVFPPGVTVPSRHGRRIRIDPRRALSLAYAITTHKSQGSEYDHIIYVLYRSMGIIRTRRNLYTGITRGKHSCDLVSDAKSLSYAVWNNDKHKMKRR